MPIGKVWIYRLLFMCLCVCLFVRLRISPPRIKLAASNFTRLFIGVLGRESHMARSYSALATRRIGMCGYTAVPEDGRTCYSK